MLKSYPMGRSLTLLSVAFLSGVFCAGKVARAEARDAPALTFGQTSFLAQNATGASFALAAGQTNLFADRPEKLRLHDASAGDTVLAMGDAADLTILMDASQPQSGAHLSIEQPARLDGVWSRAAARFHLAYLQSNERTLLVWNAPSPAEVLRVAKQLAAAGKATRTEAGAVVPAPDRVPSYLRQPASFRAVATSPSDPLLVELLRYLRKESIASGPSFSKNLPVSDLPVELQERVVARARALTAASAPTLAGWSHPNWAQARLKLSRPLNRDFTNPAFLWVDGAFPELSLAIPAFESPIATPPKVQAAKVQPVLLDADAQHPGEQPKAAAGTVHLRARQAPLQDVLRELEKQSGFSLRLDAQTAALDARVTARIREATLDEVLASLARLYGLHWSRAENGGQVASLAVADPDARLMLRLGNSHGALRDTWDALDGSKGVSLVGQPNLGVRVVQEIGEGTLLQAGDKGVPFSDLPPDLQQEVSARIQGSAALRVLEQRRGFDNANWNEATLHVQNSPLCLSDEATGSLVATLRLSGGVQVLVAAPPEATQIEQVWNRLSQQVQESITASAQRARGATLPKTTGEGATAPQGDGGP